MRRLIDTHCHIFCEEFQGDREKVVERALENGVCRLCLPNIDLKSLEPLLEVCDLYPEICFPMIGLHPTDLGEDYKGQLKELYSILTAHNMPSGNGRFVGIGETGLDLYWDKTRLADQLDSLETQIGWALEFDLPLSIHCRQAYTELLELFEKYRGEKLRGVLHCFSGSAHRAGQFMEFEGLMFGVGGTVTYKKSTVPEALSLIPLSRVVVETDAPYLAPMPYRGKRNEPSYLKEVVDKLALIYGESREEVADRTAANACSLFRLEL